MRKTVLVLAIALAAASVLACAAAYDAAGLPFPGEFGMTEAEVRALWPDPPFSEHTGTGHAFLASGDYARCIEYTDAVTVNGVRLDVCYLFDSGDRLVCAAFNGVGAPHSLERGQEVYEALREALTRANGIPLAGSPLDSGLCTAVTDNWWIGPHGITDHVTLKHLDEWLLPCDGGEIKVDLVYYVSSYGWSRVDAACRFFMQETGTDKDAS